ncbi:hypothetical protein ACSBR2_015544 [Camellia fascicularis]
MESLELPEVTDECEDVSHRCLVGRILAPKILNKHDFEDLEDRVRVLQEAPWSVMGSLLVLQPLQPGMAADELDFCWSPFWVQVHGLPFEKMTCAHREVIGNRIGRLLEFEALSDGPLLHRSFLRLRVEVDVTKPLLQGFVLRHRGDSGPGNDGIKVYYKYEKLTEFCYDCGRIGHDKQACKFVSRKEGLSSSYGPNQ